MKCHITISPIRNFLNTVFVQMGTLVSNANTNLKFVPVEITSVCTGPSVSSTMKEREEQRPVTNVTVAKGMIQSSDMVRHDDIIYHFWALFVLLFSPDFGFCCCCCCCCFLEAGKFCQYTSTDICTKNGQPGIGKANFAFCVNNGLCKAKVGDNEPHPGCSCEEGFTGDHCEFLGNTTSGSSSSGSNSGSGSTTSASVSSSTDSSNVEQANQSKIVAVSSILIAVLVVAGLFVLRARVRSGRSAHKDKAAVEAGAAVAAAEIEASADRTLLSTLPVRDQTNNPSTRNATPFLKGEQPDSRKMTVNLMTLMTIRTIEVMAAL
jgi:hypothetical protein